MSDFSLYIATALALIFVIEGMAYALFPGFVRKMMATALMIPPNRLRAFGVIMAVSGFGLVWLMQLMA